MKVDIVADKCTVGALKVEKRKIEIMQSTAEWMISQTEYHTDEDSNQARLIKYQAKYLQ